MNRHAFVVLAAVAATTLSSVARADAPAPGLTSATFGSANTNNPLGYVITVRNAAAQLLSRGGTTFTVAVTGPGDVTMSDPVLVDDDDGHYDGSFTATKPGTYSVTITLTSDPEYVGAPTQINSSPYVVAIDGPDAAHCVATGPGVSGGSLGHPASFTVTARDVANLHIATGNDPFAASVTYSPLSTGTLALLDLLGLGDLFRSAVATSLVDNRDGTYSGSYTPASSGTYVVSITLDGAPIAGSPYHPAHH